MKVLHVNASDIEGGAARAAYRLHRALVVSDIASRMLVQKRLSDDESVDGPTTKIQKGFAAIRPTLDALQLKRYPNRSKTPFSAAWVPCSPIVEQINASGPDVVHLHWINGGMMRVEDIAKIKAPVVWSLHDMWPITGGCHYDENCGAYKRACGKCKVLRSPAEQDLSAKVYRRKKRVFSSKKDLTLVGVSRWLADEAKASSLFSEFPVFNLPNPINTDIYAPFDKVEARRLLNLPEEKKLVLFGAIGATSDPRKGFQELGLALNKLSRPDVDLVVFGATQPSAGNAFKQDSHYLGRLYDDLTLRILYCAADVMVVPSLQEAFGQTASEAMSCGTPVVAFGATGLLDIVDHKKNGYLAEPFNVEDLARGIEWVLGVSDNESLSVEARNKVLDKFCSHVVARQYVELYRSALERSEK